MKDLLLFSREELEILLEGLETLESHAKQGKAFSSLLMGLLAGKSGRDGATYKAAEARAEQEERELIRAVQRRTLPLRAKLMDLIEATPSHTTQS